MQVAERERERGYMVCSGLYEATETWKDRDVDENSNLAGHHPWRGPPLKGIAYTHNSVPTTLVLLVLELRDNNAAISVGGDHNMHVPRPLGALCILAGIEIV